MKIKNTLCLVGLLAAQVSLAQSFDSTAYKYGNTINAEELKEHLYIIASDKYEGRETGKKGQKMAMEYLINEFKSSGIQPFDGKSFTQSFDLIEQINTGIKIEFGEEAYRVNTDFSFSPSFFTNQVMDLELVFIGYGIEEGDYSDYEKVDVSGKAVLYLEGTPPNKEFEKKWSSKQKAKLANEKGAAAILTPSENLENLLVQYAHYFSKPKMKLADGKVEKEIPLIRLTHTMAEKLFEGQKVKWSKVQEKGLKKYKPFSKEIKISVNRPTQNLTSENVLAYIPGTSKKEELLVITAHYDHIGIDDSLVFNGADDDGTGTVTLIEIAEAFSLAVKAGFKPKRSILIMPVSGEEKGLLGSRYYTENPVFPLESTVANLNIDMIGRYDEKHATDSNYIYLIGSDKLSADLHKLSEKTNEIYSNINLDYTFNDENDPNRFYYRSDHYNFAKNDIPVIFYFSGVHEDYHKATDTVEKIDYKKTERVARLVFYTAWNIAYGDAPIKLNPKEEK